MNDLEQLLAFAGSRLPDDTDDDAFRAEMAMLDTEAEVAAFAKAFGVARTTVIGWQAGRYAPHPALRLSYCSWLRRRAGERAEQARAAALQAQAAFAASAAAKSSGS